MTTLALLTHWRAAVLAALLALVGTLGVAARHYHAEVAVARAQAAAAHAEIATVRADAARNQAALESVAAEAAARAETDQLIRSSIHAAPSTSDCARSPAVRALLLGLRDEPGARSPAGAGGPAVVRR